MQQLATFTQPRTNSVIVDNVAGEGIHVGGPGDLHGIAFAFTATRITSDNVVPQIPRDLLSSAYLSLDGEPAWLAQDALKVIEWATTARVAVLGGEIWLPTKPGPTIPTPYIYAHETRQSANEDWNRFVLRANAACADYVRHFRWDSNDKQHLALTPYFNLTIIDNY